MIHRVAKMADDDAGKEHSGRPETDAAELQTAKSHAENAYEREDTDGMGNRLDAVQLKEPVHDVASAKQFTLPASVIEFTLVATIVKQ